MTEAEEVIDIIRLNAHGDFRTCSAALDDLLQRLGYRPVIDGLATAVTHMTGLCDIGDSYAGVSLVDDDGAALNPDAMFPDPTEWGNAFVWCARYVVATANKDTGMQDALFNSSALSILDRRLIAMVNHAAAIYRENHVSF